MFNILYLLSLINIAYQIVLMRTNKEKGKESFPFLIFFNQTDLYLCKVI